VNGLLRVVATGSECTGKTTLAVHLADQLGALWVPEAARLVADEKGSPLDASDVSRIARRHVALADAAAAESARRDRHLLVLDTDLLSTVVYARHYYGSCPALVEASARARLADLYLLHHPDVPWIPDSARDRPDQRAEIHALFEGVLREFGASVVDILGGWDVREKLASTAVALLRQRPFRASEGPVRNGPSG
jgi:NadR type nicotinamide-nucleotide adenylyltransferase